MLELSRSRLYVSCLLVREIWPQSAPPHELQSQDTFAQMTLLDPLATMRPGSHDEGPGALGHRHYLIRFRVSILRGLVFVSASGLPCVLRVPEKQPLLPDHSRIPSDPGFEACIMHKHMYLHTYLPYKHAYIHKCIHTDAHAYIHSYIHT